ncbi:MAG: tRNA uridine-5-carboxymethylaminomethyl(34) synthesis GTPase MnmE [Chromatiales bacterium 21-64-14]|nr:MAG: tRNA uridine-5-carboxymethylaminomethyl(34) synthesis GTPase MnmE [Chromatiales bacterium 21-64-14]HQU14590.1 tRNA uridine-5-carboxymethylaminomethyl(34) synthesis GTPase MnmE [Gammaproteobacteria bacterium]
MNDVDQDTITALATPPGRGGVGIVRVSGPAAASIARALLGFLPAPRMACYRRFRDVDGTTLDHGLALFFPTPNSFTGEDVLELHAHGAPVVLDSLLRRVCGLGARLAGPGEFSRRAFLNGKLDLVQAEAVADLIASATGQAARAALRSLEGVFSTQVCELVEAVAELRAYVEGAIDFPEEDIDFLARGQVDERLEALSARLLGVQGPARQGFLLHEGLRIAIVGRPNVGKSTLLNRLVGRAAAIVTDVPGTTRDVLREVVDLDGMPLHLVDTAGLRDTGDAVEREGVRRAWEEIGHADRILLVVDDRAALGAEDQPLLAKLPTDVALTVIRNKIDLSGHPPGQGEQEGRTQLWLSAHTGAGVDVLRAHLRRAAGLEEGASAFVARRRHLDALDRAQLHLTQGRRQLQAQGAPELLAEDLRHAQRALGEITGAVTTEDLLGRIFASFCIGK